MWLMCLMCASITARSLYCTATTGRPSAQDQWKVRRECDLIANLIANLTGCSTVVIAVISTVVNAVGGTVGGAVGGTTGSTAVIGRGLHRCDNLRNL